MNTEIGSPLHIHVAAFLWRTRKRSGFVAIALLLGTLGVLGGSQMTLVGWLALVPLGGVIWLLFLVIGRQMEKDRERTAFYADLEDGALRRQEDRVLDALVEGQRNLEKEHPQIWIPDPRSDAELREELREELKGEAEEEQQGD